MQVVVVVVVVVLKKHLWSKALPDQPMYKVSPPLIFCPNLFGFSLAPSRNCHYFVYILPTSLPALNNKIRDGRDHVFPALFDIPNAYYITSC